MIGLSVSRCVAAIARGEVKIEDVEKIIGSTTVPQPIAWLLMIPRYCEREWKDFPHEAVAILMQLVEGGKIEQPRLVTGLRPAIIDGKIWVGSESEIEWETPPASGGVGGPHENN
jgi:hypothetical protein